MRPTGLSLFVAGVVIAGLGASCTAAGESPRPEDQRAQVTRVHAVLESKCAQCHDAKRRRPKGDFGYVLDLKRMAADPDLVVPSQPDASKLWTIVRDDQMPPPDGKHVPLTSEEKEVIHSWIAAGAPVGATQPSRSPAAADSSGKTPVERFFGLLGKLHLLVVHFPIALLPAAVLAELWSAWRSSRYLESTVRFCVLLGAAGAVVATALGWLHADIGGYGAGAIRNLSLHRWLGTSASVCCVGIAVLSEWDVRRQRRSRLFRVALLMGALLVAAAAHFGGTLVHGDAFFDL
jgi:uncharacterized membrane protein